ADRNRHLNGDLALARLRRATAHLGDTLGRLRLPVPWLFLLNNDDTPPTRQDLCLCAALPVLLALVPLCVPPVAARHLARPHLALLFIILLFHVNWRRRCEQDGGQRLLLHQSLRCDLDLAHFRLGEAAKGLLSCLLLRFFNLLGWGNLLARCTFH